MNSFLVFVSHQEKKEAATRLGLEGLVRLAIKT
jgi:hypothetical protein